MAYQTTVYNVMIASPSDVAAERHAVRQVLSDWNAVHSESRGIVLLPVGWETHSSPQMGDHPQKILNEQILVRSDLLVGVFWTRVGTPTTAHVSGSVEEIEEHVRAGKPAMLYFSNQPVRPDSVHSEQYEKLLEFKDACKKRSFYEEYEDVSDFKDKFFRHLQLRLNNDPYFQGTSPAQVEPSADPMSSGAPVTELSNESKLLLAAAAEADGTVMRLAYIGGTEVSAGGRNFIDSSDRRTVARWEAAVDELEREGLIEDKAGRRELYLVTHEGFRVADTLPKPS